MLLLALGAVAIGVAWFLSEQRSPTRPPGIVVLAAYVSNGEQVVTFRTDPTNADVIWAGVVSAAVDGTTQPRTVRHAGAGFSVRLPVPTSTETNFTLHFLAFPKRSAGASGKSFTGTPGSYTLAYTPTEDAHRVRIGIALEQSRLRDLIGRVRDCWDLKSLGPLRRKSYPDPWFVTTEVFTNAAPVGVKP